MNGVELRCGRVAVVALKLVIRDIAWYLVELLLYDLCRFTQYGCGGPVLGDQFGHRRLSLGSSNNVRDIGRQLVEDGGKSLIVLLRWRPTALNRPGLRQILCFA